MGPGTDNSGFKTLKSKNLKFFLDSYVFLKPRWFVGLYMLVYYNIHNSFNKLLETINIS